MKTEWLIKSSGQKVSGNLIKVFDSDKEKKIAIREKSGLLRILRFSELTEEDQKFVDAFIQKKVNANGTPVVAPEGKNSKDLNVKQDLQKQDIGYNEPEKYALLIGINKYKQVNPLDFCGNDAILMAETFLKCGYKKENIFIVSDVDESKYVYPSKKNIEEQLEAISLMLNKNDTLVVTFSGHGTSIDNKGYLCPIDMEYSIDEKKTADSLLDREKLYNWLNTTKATTKILIIDACRNVAIEKSGQKTSRDLAPVLTEIRFEGDKTLAQKSFCLMTSCQDGKRSYEDPDIKHGLFTYYIAEALKGHVRKDQKDMSGPVVSISVHDVHNYAVGKLENYQYASSDDIQKPILNSQNNGDDASTMIIGVLDTEEYKKIQEEKQKDKSNINSPVQSVDPAPTVNLNIRVFIGSGTGLLVLFLMVCFWIRKRNEKNSKHKKIIVKVGTVPGAKNTLRVNDLDLNFCWCPPGSFTMGQPSSISGKSDEHQCKVTLSQGFWMLDAPITQKLYKTLLGKNPSYFSNEGRGKELIPHIDTACFPVECVTWSDADNFCKLLNRILNLNGWNFALPTEAQWEYACRARAKGDFSGSGKLEEMGWFYDNSTNRTHEVKTKTPNAWNLYDMHGNVMEWCADWYESDVSCPSEVIDPSGPKSGNARCCRGGSWMNTASDCRIVARGKSMPITHNETLGFRIILIKQTLKES